MVAKCKGLNASGMTCYHWCGGYAVPCPTATGSIQRDMCLIDSCLGVGEVAVSDHRSSVPSVNHLANIARCMIACRSLCCIKTSPCCTCNKETMHCLTCRHIAYLPALNELCQLQGQSKYCIGMLGFWVRQCGVSISTNMFT